MESEAPASAGDSVEIVLRDLRDAVEFREAEHARRNRNRVLFSRGVTLYALGIVFGLILLGRVFDTQVFKERLYARLQGDAPVVLDRLRGVLNELAPVYRQEVARSLPGFSETVELTIAGEAGTLVGALGPLTTGDLSPACARADQVLAARLLNRFGPELHGDEQLALNLAKAFRAEELKGNRLSTAHEIDVTLASLGEINTALHAPGPPEKEIFQESALVDSFGSTAIDLVKTALLEGEIGFRRRATFPAAAGHAP